MRIDPHSHTHTEDISTTTTTTTSTYNIYEYYKVYSSHHTHTHTHTRGSWHVPGRWSDSRHVLHVHHLAPAPQQVRSLGGTFTRSALYTRRHTYPGAHVHTATAAEVCTHLQNKNNIIFILPSVGTREKDAAGLPLCAGLCPPSPAARWLSRSLHPGGGLLRSVRGSSSSNNNNNIVSDGSRKPVVYWFCVCIETAVYLHNIYISHVATIFYRALMSTTRKFFFFLVFLHAFFNRIFSVWFSVLFNIRARVSSSKSTAARRRT